MSQDSAGTESAGTESAGTESAGTESAGTESAGTESAVQARPLLTVVRGEPTMAELAALTVVIGALARRGSQLPAPTPARSQWAARDRMLRQPLAAGRGAWRASALPPR